MDHPNIVKLYDIYNTTKRVVLSTEYCGNVNLQNYLEQNTNVIKLATIKEIILSLTKALAYLEARGICHRDIKLDNILINDMGVVKLIDFGFAVMQEDKELITNFCGTPSYMSPEIINRDPYDGHKADMWALGVVMFRLICGKYPFKGSHENDLYAAVLNGKLNFPPGTSKPSVDLIERLLSKDPKCRPTAKEALLDHWFRSN